MNYKQIHVCTLKILKNLKSAILNHFSTYIKSTTKISRQRPHTNLIRYIVCPEVKVTDAENTEKYAGATQTRGSSCILVISDAQKQLQTYTQRTYFHQKIRWN